jgi:SHS2 domain-containing protein
MVVEGPTLASLFEEAARGLAELVLEEPSASEKTPAELVRIRAGDREALLVDWLNELIFLSETRARVYTHVRVIHVSNTELEATVAGVFPKTLRTAVKGATHHQLKVEGSAKGYTATVVLDV